MSEVKAFDLFESPLAPRVMLEASAGSGKTWVLTGLYIRLLLECDVTVDRVLVLTFTKLATKELKERIQNRLRESLVALKEGVQDDGDEFLLELVRRYGHNDAAVDRLRVALYDFDRSMITTIHGFCQQLLGEEPLLTGTPFRFDLDPSGESLQQAIEDVWRRWVRSYSDFRVGKTLLNALEKPFGSLESMRKRIETFQNHSHSEIILPVDLHPEHYFEELDALWFSVRKRWPEEKETILKVIEASGVNRGHVTNQLPSRFKKLDTWFEPEVMEPPDREQIRTIGQFTPDYFNEKLNQGGSLPIHPLFELFAELEQRLHLMGEVVATLQYRFAVSVLEEREKLSRQADTADYNDLLIMVKRALSDSDRGSELAGHLLGRFPYALVDEFQDTDPHQYEIFRAIWPKEGEGHGLFMVGDPKQAIYSFRGGDIYTYLRARSETPVSSRFSLPYNYRSRPALVEAVNRIFTPEHESPFLEGTIRFQPARPGVPEREEEYTIDGRVPEPVSLFFTDSDDGELPEKDAMWQAVASQVSELLAAGHRGEACIKSDGSSRPVSGGDIAILVQRNDQADRIKRELARFGVRSVGNQRENIYQTRETELLIRFFRAVLDPLNQRAIRDLVATGLLGADLQEIHGELADEESWSRLSMELSSLKQFWVTRGCYPMVRRYLFEDERVARMAWWDSRERVLANLEQLMERISEVESRLGLSPSAVLSWLERAFTDGLANEEESLYLESDEDLVRVLTIHSSKGLEFPVVFLPTLWSVSRMDQKNHMERVHDSEPPHRSTICFGDPDSAVMKDFREMALLEKVGEEIRTCYVALTRARYECRIFLSSGKQSAFCGLSAVFRGAGQVRSDLARNVSVSRKSKSDKVLTPDQLWEPLVHLARSYPEIFRMENVLPNRTYVQNSREIDDPEADDLARPTVVPRAYSGPRVLVPETSRFNFSALVHHGIDSVESRDYDHLYSIAGHQSNVTVPEYDSEVVTGGVEEGDSGSEERNMFTFPRGARAGTFIHKLFEHPDFDFRSSRLYSEIVADVSRIHGVEEVWNGVLTGMMESVARADYGALNPGRVSPREMLKEMEFYFPSADVPSSSLQRIIRDGVSSEQVFRGDVNGLMNGFIDLVVRDRGRYYILDYKSNDLGGRPEDYHEEALKGAMITSGYDLQYHIYLTALVKYLRDRDPAFSYESSIGGVYYLFVRGMSTGHSAGIYHDLPPRERIEELESVWGRV